jgi:acyl-ACP thioesterase
MWIDTEPGVKQFFTEQNMAQLLASRQVEVVRVPDFKEELTVTTSVYGMKPMFGFRNTFIYDAEGKPCYRTWSMGAFVDKSNGKLKRVDDATMASMTLEPQLEMNYGDRRIAVPKEGGQVLLPIPVMKADIDYNRHVNNANYIRMAMEFLPEGFQVAGLRVEYRVAAKLGDTLLPTLYRLTEDTILVTLSIGNEVSAIAEFTAAR